MTSSERSMRQNQKRDESENALHKEGGTFPKEGKHISRKNISSTKGHSRAKCIMGLP